VKKIICFLLCLATSVFAGNDYVTNDATHPVPVTAVGVAGGSSVSAPGATPSPSPALAQVVQGISGGTAVTVAGAASGLIVTDRPIVAGAPITANYFAAHITTNTTTNVTASSAYISSLVITCTAAGTTEIVKVQNKEGTPKVLYQSGTLAVGTLTTPSISTPPLLMTSGIDIVTSGSGAATVDVFITYWQ
jgi:hypothetical protein